MRWIVSGSLMQKIHSSFGLKIGKWRSWRIVEAKALPNDLKVSENLAVSKQEVKEVTSTETPSPLPGTFVEWTNPGVKLGEV